VSQDNLIRGVSNSKKHSVRKSHRRTQCSIAATTKGLRCRRIGVRA